MSGTFNVRNAAMAITAAHFYQIPLPEIAKAVAAFTGVKRRQEVRGEVRGVTIIDDFGHPPDRDARDVCRACAIVFRTGVCGRCSSRAATRRGGPFFQKELPAALALADRGVRRAGRGVGADSRRGATAPGEGGRGYQRGRACPRFTSQMRQRSWRNWNRC